MKLKISVPELREGLAQAAITLDKRKYLGRALVYMLAKKKDTAQHLLLYTNDGMAESLIWIPCDVTEAGECALDPVRLVHLLSMAPDTETAQLALTPKGNQLSLKIGKITQSKMAVDLEAAKLMDQVKHLPIGKEATLLIKSDAFREILTRTQHFTAQDAAKINLQSVVVQTTNTGYEGMASDGIVLARVTVDDDNAVGKTESFRIPSGAIPALCKVLDRNKKATLKLIIDKGTGTTPLRLYVKTDNTIYGTVLNSESFPNTDKVFAASIVVSVKLPAAELTKSMSQADMFAHESFVAVLMDEESIKIRSSNSEGEFEQELAAETVTWPLEGPPTKMGFNVKRMMTIARALRDEPIELGYADGLKMAFIKTANEVGSARYAIAGARESAA